MNPSIAAIRSLPSIRPHLLIGASVLWTLVTTPVVLYLSFADGRVWALPALACGPAAFALRRYPYAAGGLLAIGALILRVAYVGWSETDPIELSRLASIRAFSGENPYLGTYANGSPYSYGPLGLVTYRAGILGELLGTIGTSILLIHARAWMTLAFFGAWPLFLYSAVSGNNDYSAGFLLLLSLVVIRSHPKIGMVILAAAIAIKPYSAAWLIPAIGYGGAAAAAVAAAASLVFWAPVLFIWGLPSFLDALRRVDEIRDWQAGRYPSWAFADIPALRLLILPFSFAGLIWRSWFAMALLGSAGFLVFLGFSPWAHHAYLAVVIPVIGLALEWRPVIGPTGSEEMRA